MSPEGVCFLRKCCHSATDDNSEPTLSLLGTSCVPGPHQPSDWTCLQCHWTRSEVGCPSSGDFTDVSSGVDCDSDNQSTLGKWLISGALRVQAAGWHLPNLISRMEEASQPTSPPLYGTTLSGPRRVDANKIQHQRGTEPSTETKVPMPLLFPRHTPAGSQPCDQLGLLFRRSA